MNAEKDPIIEYLESWLDRHPEAGLIPDDVAILPDGWTRQGVVDEIRERRKTGQRPEEPDTLSYLEQIIKKTCIKSVQEDYSDKLLKIDGIDGVGMQETENDFALRVYLEQESEEIREQAFNILQDSGLAKKDIVFEAIGELEPQKRIHRTHTPLNSKVQGF